MADWLPNLRPKSLYARKVRDTSHTTWNASTALDALFPESCHGGPVLAALVCRAVFLPIMDLITVLIADARVLPRRRLQNFLALQKDIRVVGEAMGGRVLNRVEALQPHILMLDMRMPKMDELKVLPRIHAKSPRTKILLLAESFEEDFIARALQDGVHGCVLTTASPTELVKVIRAIYAGENLGPTQAPDPGREKLAPAGG